MLSRTIANPFMKAPPDKLEMEQALTYPQQIVFFTAENVDAVNQEFESEVDSQLSGYTDEQIPSIFNLYDYTGLSTSTGSMYSGVYATPSPSCGDSDSGHSTTEPPTPSSDFDYISLEASSSDYDYKEELLISAEEVHSTPRGQAGETFESVQFSFGTLAHAPSVPCLSPSMSTGPGQPLWQQMNCAAAADVRGLLHHDYTVAGLNPSASVHSFTAPHWEEVISYTHPSSSWSRGASVDKGPTTVPCAGGVIDPTLLTLPITQASYHYSAQAPLYGQEQRQKHVAPADALGLGSSVPGDSCQVVVPQPTFHTTLNESPHYLNPCDAMLGQSVNKSDGNIPSKKPATRKTTRQQSTEKVHACLWPGCTAAFARTNNLRVHEDSVHLGLRGHTCPFAGCLKAENGYSRKHDLDVHIQNRHAAGLKNTLAAWNHK